MYFSSIYNLFLVLCLHSSVKLNNCPNELQREMKTTVSFEHRHTSQLLFTAASHELYKDSYPTSLLDLKFLYPEYKVPEQSARLTVHQKRSHLFHPTVHGKIIEPQRYRN